MKEDLLRRKSNSSFIRKSILLLLLHFSAIIFAQAGSIDTSFNPADSGFGNGDGTNNTVNVTAVQSDGKIIIGGNFSSYNGTGANYIARLNADGSLDMGFNSGGTGFNNTVSALTVQSDGKIIIGGSFTAYNGTTMNQIARLNADGSLDTSFNLGSGTNGPVTAVIIQSDGKIIIGGYFNTYNGTVTNRVARLNTDGSLDAGFNTGNTGADGVVYAITVQSDGKIIIGGNFMSYNGTAINRIARLNANGTLDTTFNVGGTGANTNVYVIAVQSDGKIIAGGAFNKYNGTATKYIARLNADGSLDTGFYVGIGANNTINTLTVQSNGKIITGGNFTSYNGTAINNIARLNTNGSLDTSFIGSGANNSVLVTTAQPDGKIITGGGFTVYNDRIRGHIVRLNTDGSTDTNFNAGTGADNVVSVLTVQSGGKIIMGGNFTSYNGTVTKHIARLNTNGSLDSGFNVGGSGANGMVNILAVQSDSKIIIGGSFSSYNGTSMKNIARLNADGTLDISFNIGSGPNSTINAITVQSDGKIIIGGDFTSYNGTAINRIARLNANGSLDTGFNVGGSGATSMVNILAVQSDGKIIIGGNFYQYNSPITNKVNNIDRLNTDGSLDTSFVSTGANGPINTITIQSDDKIIIGGYFSIYNDTAQNNIVRLNANGSLDTGFNVGGSGTNNSVSAITIQPDGKITIGGNFYYYNDSLSTGIARLNTDGSLDTDFNVGTGALYSIIALTHQSDDKIIIGGSFTSYKGTGRNRIARINGSITTTAQSFCGDANTIANLTAAGQNLKWYAAASGGSALDSGTTLTTDTTYFVSQTVNGVESARTAVAVTMETTPPIIETLTAITVNADSGTATYAASQLTKPTATDNCNVASVIASPAVLNMGDNTVTWTATDASGNISTSNQTVTIAQDLGTSQFDMTGLSYYPNPVKGDLTVSYNNEISSLEVFNLLGQHIISVCPNAANTKVDMSDLPAGAYLLQVYCQGKSATIKVIKN